ncbi:hypothetical protein [Sideroxydans sp. CL21]|nr:hypothetical protein [Sideroxydans sp. CL21]
MNKETKETLRQLFCVVAVIALFVLAVRTVFPYGPPSAGFDEPTTNPYYLAMPWYENLWRWCVGAALIASAVSVVLTMMALSEEKQQLRYKQEQLRQALSGELRRTL